MFNLIIFIVLILSISAILVIIYRKLPLLSQLEIDDMEKEKKTKYKLLEKRLKRKIEELAKKTKIASVAERASILKSPLQKIYFFIKTKKRDYLEEKRANKEYKKEEILEDPVLDALEETKENIDDVVVRPSQVEQPLTLLEQAVELFKRGNVKHAEQIVFDIIKQDPKAVEAYKLLAKIYNQAKNYVHAEATLEHVVSIREKLNEINPHDYLELARTKIKVEKLEEALAQAKKAIELAPSNPKILHFLIKACILCKQKDLAWKYYHELKRCNGNSEGLNELLDELKRL